MRPFVTPAMTATALAMVFFCLGCGGQEPTESDVAGMVVSSHRDVRIDWASDWDSAFSTARADNKAVLVTFYADWCIWCKRLEDTTLADGQVAAFLADNVVPLRLDVDGAGEELSNRLEVDGLPTILVFDSDGEEIGRIPGYMPPGGFLDRVKSFLS